ncbi:hypothetical protein [Brevibacillus migulae]|uniref:hypothetical protein n=1 Tax=Brevibacillus migulae TaxID=1644114 RepID=UPI00106EBC40|nr:hypothetical protein [Brevibacillus migulae]
MKYEDAESNLPLKIVGYFLLGAFTFQINEFAVPLGFLVFRMFVRPAKNSRVKQRAVYFGFAIFVLQLMIPAVIEYIYEYPRKVTATSADVYKLSFTHDWSAIKDSMQIDPDAHLEDFRSEYLKNGQLRRLSYNLVSHSEDGYIHYRIRFSPEKKEYSIRRNKVGDRWAQYDRTVKAERFFEVLDQAQVRTLLQNQAYVEYSLISDGEMTSYGIKETSKFLVKDKEIRQISNNELPVTGYYIVSCGKDYKWVSGIETSGCDAVVDFLFE